MFEAGRTTDHCVDAEPTDAARRQGPAAGVPWLQIALAGSVAALLRSVIVDGGGWLTLLTANTVGCLLFGVLVACGRATPALAGGFCGSLTTFSGVMLQARSAAAGIPLGATAVGGSFALPTGAPGVVTLLTLTVASGLAAFLAGRRLGGRRDAVAAEATR